VIELPDTASGSRFVHSLSVAVWSLVAGGALYRAFTVWRSVRRARRRLSHVLVGETSRRPSLPGRQLPAGVRRWFPPTTAVLVCWALLGGGLGLTVGLAVGWGVHRSLVRRARAGQDADASDAALRLPLAADLLAACVAAGADPREAARAGGEAMGGPVGRALAHAAAELRLGGEPTEVWARFGRIPGAQSLARCLERAAVTGAPAAEPVARVADRLRAERVRKATARAQRAHVLITGPVGLCFLPAFLAVGVAPVVLAMTAGALHGG
jgi:hypothetical protein